VAHGDCVCVHVCVCLCVLHACLCVGIGGGSGRGEGCLGKGIRAGDTRSVVVPYVAASSG